MNFGQFLGSWGDENKKVAPRYTCPAQSQISRNNQNNLSSFLHSKQSLNTGERLLRTSCDTNQYSESLVTNSECYTEILVGPVVNTIRSLLLNETC